MKAEHELYNELDHVEMTKKKADVALLNYSVFYLQGINNMLSLDCDFEVLQ